MGLGQSLFKHEFTPQATLQLSYLYNSKWYHRYNTASREQFQQNMMKEFQKTLYTKLLLLDSELLMDRSLSVEMVEFHKLLRHHIHARFENMMFHRHM